MLTLHNRFQAGFRPDYRTTDHIFTFNTTLNKYLYKNKKPVFACFVDFSKAFGKYGINIVNKYFE
jgi:hypothetical protein